MKKIIITGGSGFIGKNFINSLINKKFSIHNFDKLSKVSSSEKFKLKKNKYKFYKINLINYKLTKKLIFQINPDIIINFAAESHVDRSIDNPLFFLKNNFISSINLFKIFRDYSKNNGKCKFFHISTDEVYGSNNYNPSKENSPYKPTSPYSSSKASSDLVALSFNHTFKTCISIINLCNNYGPYQHLEKFIPTCIFNLLQNKSIPIYGSGKNIREWIYVEDACEAIMKILNLKQNYYRFNIGSKIRINNFSLAKKIFVIMKKMKKTNMTKQNYYKFVTDRPGHDLRYALNSSLFYKKTKYKLKNNIDKGLNKTIRWYLKNHEWVKSIKKNYSGKRVGLND
tara:strand:+ start:9 stop:1031 length:1023 start_codon:yes stop_codon:yes gene_type:complete